MALGILVHKSRHYARGVLRTDGGVSAPSTSPASTVVLPRQAPGTKPCEVALNVKALPLSILLGPCKKDESLRRHNRRRVAPLGSRHSPQLICGANG